MKPGTVCAVDRLDKLLDDEDFAAMVSADMWIVSPGRYKNNMHVLTADDIQTIRSLLRKLPAAEKCLARGGMVRDAGGRWCSHGDRVRFRTGRNADYVYDDWQYGKLYYDASDCLWYIETEVGDWFRLGDNWEEVCWWKYEGEKK